MTRLFWIFVLLAALSGCAAATPETTAPLSVAQDEAGQSADPVGDMFRLIAGTALGTPYARGGTDMNGFDCSGFVQWAYKNMGIKLPRTAREQSQVGRSVGRDDLRAGDIVAFRHPRRGWHSGIYMGDDQFVHSPRRRQQVRYSSMSNPYFRAHFVAARRVLEDGADLDYEAITRRVALAESEKRPSREEPGRELPKKRKSASQKSAKGKKTDKARGKAAAGDGATTFSGKDDRGARL